MNIGNRVRNTRSGVIGIVIRIFKGGSIAVLEKIAPCVINTHDNENTLELIEDECIAIFDERV